jgi:hypothetical protein
MPGTKRWDEMTKGLREQPGDLSAWPRHELASPTKRPPTSGTSTSLAGPGP